MTRRNDKRNQRRTRNHGNEKPELSPIASMLLGALLGKGAEMVAKASEKHKETKPFNGIRNVSDNCFESGVCVPTDGTAKEIPVPKGFEIFISEDGKPMVRKKIKGDGEPQKEHLTYEKIADDLFHCSCFDIYGDKIFPAYKNSIDNCNSEAQARRLLAFNKLQNIAKYLNEGWNPDFNDDSQKFFIILDFDNKYNVAYNTYESTSVVYFKTEELANRAITIMGKDSLADLFNTNW